MLYPSSHEPKSMLDAISPLGILMLLLLTGMETDLKLVRKVGRAAITVLISGISVPFVCGFALGQYLPESILSDQPQQPRLYCTRINAAYGFGKSRIAAGVSVLTLHRQQR
jgi:Kef-type K+ transport system membrane component KefB